MSTRARGAGRAQESTPVRLDFRSVQKVIVTGDGEDRFVTTSKEAAIACRSALDEKAWQEEFSGFLAHINQWAKNRSDIVKKAYVGISSEGLTGVLITQGQEYRTDFDDEISDLDIDLAKRFPSCRADMLQSPEGDPESRIPYISPEWALQIYGD